MVFQHWTGVWLSLHFYISPARKLIIVKKRQKPNNHFPLTDYIYTCAFVISYKFNVKICSELLSLKELFYFGVSVPFQPLSTPKLKHVLLMLIKFSVSVFSWRKHGNKVQILCERPLPSCIQEEFLIKICFSHLHREAQTTSKQEPIV